MVNEQTLVEELNEQEIEVVAGGRSRFDAD